MKTKTTDIRTVTRTALRLLAVAAIGTVAAVALSACPPTVEAQTAVAPSYGWPVKPFDRQHPVRGAFGDPRILGRSHSFHFGVDVYCANGTPVYATISGRAYVYPRHRETVVVRGDDGRHVFDYWHIRPRINSGQRVTAYVTVVGTVVAPWEHVHFAERVDGTYVNPLRPGAMGPYKDRTTPTIRCLGVGWHGVSLAQSRLHGRVDIVTEAYDETPIPIAGPWHDKPLTPSLIEWRLTARKAAAGVWRTAVDFRVTYPSNDRWTETYAKGTRQNKKAWDACYRFYLVHDLNTRSLRDGAYEVEVRATDVGGNSTTHVFPIMVANGV
jgi:hypothetical protein